MILASILGSAGAAIVLSEMLGRGKVVYTRMLALAVCYLACCAAAGYALTQKGGGLAEFAAIVISGVPVMAAGAWLGWDWFKFRAKNGMRF